MHSLLSRRTRRVLLAFASSCSVAITTDEARAQASVPSAADSALLTQVTGGPNDWDFLVGDWTVRHRRFKTRIIGGTDEEFDGTTVVRKTLGGLGTLDDNMIARPGGEYRALAIRAYDAKSRQWLIWWLDTRYLGTPILPPLRGGFQNGVGTFYNVGTLNGRSVRIRFLWTRITPTSARWEQAVSDDGGTSWETNWIMDFTRVGGQPSGGASGSSGR